MSNTSAIRKTTENVRRDELDGWWKLAKDAELELALAKERVKKLKIALRIFTDNAQRGEPYPTNRELDQPTNA